jgi:hypothetical protein
MTGPFNSFYSIRKYTKNWKQGVTCAILAGMIFLFSTPAMTAEPAPGDACSTNGLRIMTGGPEDTSGDFLVCNGTVWKNFIDYDTAGNVGVRQTVPKAPLHVGGEVILGDTGLACDADREGGIRYNTTLNTIEICDGSSWAKMVASVCDNLPATFTFTDQTGLTTSTLTNSNIVLITGMDASCNADVSISGGGSPEYRTCSTSNCSSVVQNWTSATNNLDMQGKYLQARATTSGSAGTTVTVTVTVGTSSDSWSIRTAATDDCTGIGPGSEGTVCADGSVYAGNSPDGDVPMFVTRCDAGMTWGGASCGGGRTTKTGNDGAGNWVDTSLTNCAAYLACDASGETNTTTLIATDSNSVTAGTQLHNAAQYCADLNIHGQTDWYLPSARELDMMFVNQTAIGNFTNAGAPYYWTSSEYVSSFFWYRNFASGNWNDGGFTKNSAWYVRCARR